MATMNVSLPNLMREWVEAQVGSGEYANTSDYIRDLIRRDKNRLDHLKTAWAQAEQSGVRPRKVGDIVAAAKARLADG